MTKKIKIDLKDRKILRELDMNAKMPLGKLAKKVGLSRQALTYRIERMKKDGIILGALTIFDSAVVGQRWFRVAVQLRKISPKQKNKFINYFKKHPNILWLGEVGGNWDFVLNFVIEDQSMFDKLFEQILEMWGKLIQRYEILTYINVRDQAREYLLESYETSKKEIFHEMKFNSSLKFDELDKKIIFIISRNALLSASEISERLGVNYKTIQNRIKNLEENKVILGYRMMIHPESLDYESYMIFIAIQSYHPKLEKTLYEFLRHPNVGFVVKQLGRWRIGIEAEFENRKEFQAFLIELRTRFGSIISEYETFPVFHDHVINYFPKGSLS